MTKATAIRRWRGNAASDSSMQPGDQDLSYDHLTSSWRPSRGAVAGASSSCHTISNWAEVACVVSDAGAFKMEPMRGLVRRCGEGSWWRVSGPGIARWKLSTSMVEPCSRISFVKGLAGPKAHECFDLLALQVSCMYICVCWYGQDNGRGKAACVSTPVSPLHLSLRLCNHFAPGRGRGSASAKRRDQPNEGVTIWEKSVWLSSATCFCPARAVVRSQTGRRNSQHGASTPAVRSNALVTFAPDGPFSCDEFVLFLL